MMVVTTTTRSTLYGRCWVMMMMMMMSMSMMALTQAQRQQQEEREPDLDPTDTAAAAAAAVCSTDLRQECLPCLDEEQVNNNNNTNTVVYDCSLPGLQGFTPGQYAGITANYLSTVTSTSSPNFPIRAAEFERCTGGHIQFSEAANVWQDPVIDLGTKTSRGTELYDGYFMSYALFPEVSALGLAEPLNDRIRQDNARLKWEDMLPAVKRMSEYRTAEGVTSIDLLMFDGDFFLPVIRLDLLEKFNLPLPNTWDEVVQLAQFFNGTDLNDDGVADDFGFCHFPRSGAGSWDQWWPESVYSTWASMEQTQGTQQGFFFDQDTMEPRIQDGPGFAKAAGFWKDLWAHGESDCGNPNFTAGRCAIGYAPPGCWKTLFLTGVSRRDENNTIIWQPRMKNGDYAEPYRFKPFGSLEVVDRTSGEFTKCTPELCPLAEVVPMRGQHGDEDRASVLPPSPYVGQLINRAPLYWSGGLGTLIRKSSPTIKKDLLWDFFVYTNSPETSVNDVASYSSWLDSWRYSQLTPGDNFIRGGWSQAAYTEHAHIMQWAFSEKANGAFTTRIPGVIEYTRDVVGVHLRNYFDDKLSLNATLQEITQGWKDITAKRGKLDQLATYRASLGLDKHSEVDLCRLHRDLMDKQDPSICRKYDPDETEDLIFIIIIAGSVFLVAIFLAAYIVTKRKNSDDLWIIKRKELIMADEPEILGRGSFGQIFLAEYRGTQVAVKRAIPPPTMPEQAHNSGDTVPDIESGGGGSGDKTAMNGLKTTHFKKRRNGGMGTASYDAAKLREDFISEMRQLSKLRHPCITTLMGAVLEKNEDPLLVMEYAEHGSLYDLLRNETMIVDGELLLPILRDVTQGVRFLHAATPQIVHSDLKASNILIDNRYRAKVADFGLSQKRKSIGAGTPFWLSPEVIRGETGNTPESDAYAFGIMLYEVYARKDPYKGEDAQQVLKLVSDKKINKRPPTPTACPPKAALIMAECLDADATKRPTFEELDLQLKRLDPTTMEPLGLASKKTRTDALLEEMFPKNVAQALRDGKKVEPLSRDVVTVFFSDIVGYTDISSSLTPIQVADLLRRLYTSFDDLSKRHGVKKIETIGDSYMAVTNLTEDQSNDHAKRIAEFAFDAIEAANDTLIDLNDPDRGSLNIRVGFSSGPVVADVVGSLNPRWCLFGDVVNVASRMESNSTANRILCSKVSADILAAQCSGLLILTPRQALTVKGKGEMFTYWVSRMGISGASHHATRDHSGHSIKGLEERLRSYVNRSAGGSGSDNSSASASNTHTNKGGVAINANVASIDMYDDNDDEHDKSFHSN